MRVAVLGDSLSIPEWDYSGELVAGWPALLDSTRFTRLNLSGGGGTVGRYLRGCPPAFPCPDHRPGPWLQPRDLVDFVPDVAVVMVGAGDYYTSVGTSRYLTDLLALRDAIRAQAPAVKILYVREHDIPATTSYEGVTYPISRTWSWRQYRDSLLTVVERTAHARYVDVAPMFRDVGDWRVDDGVHLNQAGQDRLAATLACALSSP